MSQFASFPLYFNLLDLSNQIRYQTYWIKASIKGMKFLSNVSHVLKH